MYAKATLLCRIGKKTYKTNKTGETYSTLNVVTFKKAFTRNGQQTEYKEWHTVYCYSKLGDVVEKYTNVGDLIFIEGDIRHRKVTDQNQDKWLYSIVATEVKLLPNNKKDGQNYTYESSPNRVNNQNHDDFDAW